MSSRPYLTVPAPQAELLDPAVADALAAGAMRTSVELAKLRAVVDLLGFLPMWTRVGSATTASRTADTRGSGSAR